MQFEIVTEEETYIRTRLPLITQKLTTALMLLLQELHADDLKRQPIGRGLDGAVMQATNRRADEAAEKHAALFPTGERAKQEAEHRASNRSMVQPRTH